MATRIPISMSPFLRLPVEIRLHIYSYLLQPALTYDTPDDSLHNLDPATPTIHIRTQEPRAFCTLNTTLRHRFIVRDFRGRAIPTTFTLEPRPGLHVSILATSKSIHAEAAAVLYGANAFDFSSCIEAIVPFFSLLSDATRARVRTLSIAKRPQCYDKEFDRAEWEAAMEFVAGEMKVQRLWLALMTGRPAANLYADLGPGIVSNPYADGEWEVLLGVEGFEWLRHLLGIDGLKEIKLSVVEGHCPPPVSMGLERFMVAIFQGTILGLCEHTFIRQKAKRDHFRLQMFVIGLFDAS
ncbi:hypothetical protein K461DRAFT_271745 [Myriangium duriaei CBS 260.36]|uniref:DUF7730 domain-containing protein n=1 Tax=Myriangium duriaei CBS 260.36 TaxID=1168546 RepID=A0A9P4IUW9_9PEZI|nr:hypothetical protein K461DRAFT_271745 [Myriangium duriaei CBS 260.36]